MTILGYILILLGFIVGLVGDVKFLVIAYRRNLFWFFGCLFVPVIGVIFFLLNPKETWRPVLLSVMGLLLASAGYWIGGFDFFG